MREKKTPYLQCRIMYIMLNLILFKKNKVMEESHLACCVLCKSDYLFVLFCALLVFILSPHLVNNLSVFNQQLNVFMSAEIIQLQLVGASYCIFVIYLNIITWFL